MELNKRQIAFLEFIPISNIKEKVLLSYSITLYFAPILINFLFNLDNVDFQWLKFILITIDAILVLTSIPILISPKSLFVIFHLYMGITTAYISIIFFISFLVTSNTIQKNNLFNLGLLIVIYLIIVFIENMLIVSVNFSKYPKSSFKTTPILVFLFIFGSIPLKFLIDAININKMAILTFLAAILSGIPIHSLYRGYIILKYKYKPSDI